MRLVEVRAGRVRAFVDREGRPWRSAIAKEPLSGPVRVDREGLVGDEVADRKHHGGPEQAVLAYGLGVYGAWRAEGHELPCGSFGENLVMEGVDDHEACIGDVWNLGGAILQISQPRQPCETLARHVGSDELVEQTWALGRGGWYLRVLTPGSIVPGPIELLQRPHPGWTVARVLRAFDQARRHPEEARAASALAQLSPPWRAKLALKAGD
ncbi:MAG: MOSC domain-containing protein [Acidobacteria bacterium]|nr:MOSC domain-containing protein [Acidobacteriota bacterium]